MRDIARARVGCADGLFRGFRALLTYDRTAQARAISGIRHRSDSVAPAWLHRILHLTCGYAI